MHQAQAFLFVNLGLSSTGSSGADAIVGTTVKSPPFTFNHRDTILYNLGGKSSASVTYMLVTLMHSLVCSILGIASARLQDLVYISFPQYT